jgi:hypothetical protein
MNNVYLKLDNAFTKIDLKIMLMVTDLVIWAIALKMIFGGA